jgi:2,5-dihydroxypyridine 5,6-dioxygenase
VNAVTEWAWIRHFAAQFEACGVQAGEAAVVLCERASRPALVETSRLALASLGAQVAVLEATTPVNPGPVPIRSTGASVAIAGHPATIAACAAAGFVVDCTVEGLLHAPELGQILGGGARVLMISNEHPEVFDRLPFDPDLAPRVDKAVAALSNAATMHVTSAAGTDLTIDVTGAFVAGSHGITSGPGTIAHWPGGLVVAFPAAGTVNGTLVLAPGDVNLTFKEYVRTPITCTVADDYITAIDGDGLDRELFASYLAAWDEREAYAVSHVGWGLNHHCRWDVLPLYDKADINGTELRAFAGNFLYSAGANEVAGRFARGHFDLPMRNCTIELDGAVVVDAGQLIS